jgi:hypothetical protein
MSWASLPATTRKRFASAETLAEALDGRKTGRGWMARCPAHNDREPSLSIRETDDGKVLVHCHAGCDQEHVIAALRVCGLWPEGGPQPPSGSALHAAAKSQSGRERQRQMKSSDCEIRLDERTVGAD